MVDRILEERSYLSIYLFICKSLSRAIKKKHKTREDRAEQTKLTVKRQQSISSTTSKIEKNEHKQVKEAAKERYRKR